MKIVATYQSNYNGFDLGEMEELFEDQCELVREAVVDKMYYDCDEDGCYEGDISEAYEFIVNEVKKVFGQEVEVEVVFDGTSS